MTLTGAVRLDRFVKWRPKTNPTPQIRARNIAGTQSNSCSYSLLVKVEILRSSTRSRSYERWKWAQSVFGAAGQVTLREFTPLQHNEKDRGWAAICNLSGVWRFFEQGRLRLSRQRDHNLTQLGLSAELDWDLAVTVKADWGLHRGYCGQKRGEFNVSDISVQGEPGLCASPHSSLSYRESQLRCSVL